MMREWGESLQASLLQSKVHTGISLRDKTTLRIGGPAALFLDIHHREDLLKAVRRAIEGQIPWLLLGGGSNILFSDKGFDGLVIANRLSFLEKPEPGLLRCGAGLTLFDLVRAAVDCDLAGFESLAGIPGSVGGAIVGNAGAFGRSIGELLQEVEMITPEGEVVRVGPESLELDYRETRVKYSKDVVISATFKLPPNRNEDLKRRIEEILQLRLEKHPPKGVATAGSFFKNLPPEKPGGRRIAAGLILDRAGGKSLSVGEAAVFEKHANIVINRGKASSHDVLDLTARMKRLAWESSKILLDEEVRRIGFTDEELKGTDVKVGTESHV